MFQLLVLLFIIKLYARSNIFINGNCVCLPLCESSSCSNANTYHAFSLSAAWIYCKRVIFIVCIRVSTPLLFAKLHIYKPPVFRQLSLRNFSSLTPSHLLKVTKLLAEISQFIFLVVRSLLCHTSFTAIPLLN